MSTEQLISTIEPLPIQEKLALIEFLSRSVQQALSSREELSMEARATLSALQHDPTWKFVKESEEDVYSERDIKEKR